MSTPEKKSLWDRLTTPAGLVLTIVLIVSGVVGVWVTLAETLLADEPVEVALRDPAAVAAHQVTDCMRQHDMRSPSVIESPGSWSDDRKQVTVRHCDWPPVARTSTDGYTEISVTSIWPEGRNAVNPWDVVDTIRGPCTDIRATYVLSHMGGRTFVDRRVKNGRVYILRSVGRGPFVLEQVAQVPFDSPPSVFKAIVDGQQASWVFHVHHFELFDASCVLAG